MRRARVLRVSLLVLSWLLSLATTASPQAYAVTRVVDGDTVVLESIGTVRLIGIDTPETVDPRVPVQYFGRESAAYLRAMLDGQKVRLEFDQQRLDRYQRTLAYLYLSDGSFVNREMVRQGYAHAYVKYPFRYMEDFREAELQAREEGRGLWAEPGKPQAIAAHAPVRVWVNTGSGVYHCPGTRYYGNTARGEYLTEAEAQQRGHRPAGGRVCAPAAVSPAPASQSSEAPPARPLAVPQGTAALTSAASSQADIKVWVNTSSKVYHCPDTRYYGSTARGEYMPEAQAKSEGHRPAGGKVCGPAAAAISQPSATSPAPRPLATTPSSSTAPADTDVRVWVNTSSRVYHCPGTRYYGTTKAGVYMSQQDAQAKGHRPAGGTRCR
jgi:micrococcal nuclease